MTNLQEKLWGKLTDYRRCKENQCSNELALHKIALEEFNYMSKLIQLNTDVRDRKITQKVADKKRLELRKQADNLEQSLKANECASRKCKKEVLDIISIIKHNETNPKVIATIDKIRARYVSDKATMNDYLKLMDLIK